MRSFSLSYYGMTVAHIGIAVFVIGVTIVKGYGVEKDVRMAPGDTVELAGYSFRFVGVREVEGPNYVAARAAIEVTRNGSRVGTLLPREARYTRSQQTPMTEAAIDSGLIRDLYVALGDDVDGGAWVVRVQHKPFVMWIWLGCIIMALGGVLAVADRRYRIATSRARLLREPERRSRRCTCAWRIEGMSTEAVSKSPPLGRYLLLASFVVARPSARRRTQAQSARSAFAAHRQACAGVHAAAAS